MHDDSIHNKILGFANNKDARLHLAQTGIKADEQEKTSTDKQPVEKPSKAQSEYEQFLIDWEPGDPLPLFPPGKKLILCKHGSDIMRDGDERYIDDPELTARPYKTGKKSADEELLEFKNLGPKIKEGLLSLLGRVARSRGLWIDDKNKLRCPPGTPAANQFTDITGANCFIPSPQTAAQSGARAARRAFGAAETMAAQAGQRIDTSPAGRAAAAAQYSMDDLPSLVAGMDIAGRIGVPRIFAGARGGSRATKRTVPNTPTVTSLIAKREAIARGRELTAAAMELEHRFSPQASAANVVRLPNGRIVGDVTIRQDFLEAMRQLTPNVPIEEWEEYFDNAIPGNLSMADRRTYQKAWAAYWRNQIVEMLDNQDSFKFLTKLTMNARDDLGTTAITMVVEPFAPEPASGGRNVGVGPMGLAAQTNQGSRKLIAEGGFHFTMNINQMGMLYQFLGYGRDMHSDVSGVLHTPEGRAHYIATHETGHVVDFAQKLRALGIDPDVLKANGDVYGPTSRVVQNARGAIVKDPEWQSGAWKVDWSKITNPMNNPDVQKLIDAAARLKGTQYAGSRFSGRKIDLQNDLNEFYNLISYAFFENINQTSADNHFMATVAGNKYAHDNGLEARAEFYAFRRLFGELRGTRPATQTAQFGSNLQPTPSETDILTGAVVMRGQSPADWNLLSRFVDIAAEVEVQRRREAGAYRGLPTAAAVAQAEADDRRVAAAQTMRRIEDIGSGTFGKSPGAWNISGRMGQVDDGRQRPPSLHAQRVRNSVRANTIAARRASSNRGISMGIAGRMGTSDPVKPERPREPDNGPFTGSFLDVLRGAATWKEFAKKYRKQDVVFFDYETTGFGDDGNMPVQIGAVRMRGGKVVERFNIFVNPGIPLGDWAKKSLKNAQGQPLTDEWLSTQASLKEAHEKLIEFFGDNALLGGQYTPFDLEVLERILKETGLEYKPAGVIDSKAMADELLPRWTPESPDGPNHIDPRDGKRKGTNSLGPLAEYLEVDLGDGWHTADADSEASAMIIEKILDRAASRPDTPRRLLDVDQVPRIVQERRAQYERDMVEYRKAKAEYDQLIAGKMGVSQFETANGSKYVRRKDGTFHRVKSTSGTTILDDADVEKIKKRELAIRNRLSQDPVEHLIQHMENNPSKSFNYDSLEEELLRNGWDVRIVDAALDPLRRDGGNINKIDVGRVRNLPRDTYPEERMPDTSAESTFDNTVFVDSDDAYSIMAQAQRGPIIDKDGDLVGRYYDDTNLDSAKFMELRGRGAEFDAAYIQAGGSVEARKIPAARINREPQTGLQPVEWNNNNNQFHVGSIVSSITMESSSEITGRMGNPERASRAKTVQIREKLAETKSSVGAGMSDEFIDNEWPAISQRVNLIDNRPPLKKSEAVARRRQWSQNFIQNLKASIGSEGVEPRNTVLSQFLAGTEIEFQAHLASMTDDELEQEILDSLSEFHAGLDTRPRVQIPHQDLTRIIGNGYKTTHQISSDHSPSPMRRAYETQIGIHPDVPDDLRPASGYVMHADWLDAEDRAALEALEALPGVDPEVNFPEFMQRTRAESQRGPVHVYGGVEVVLRPETAGRTFYGLGDSLTERFVPASLESTDIDEIARPLTGGGLNASRNVVEMLHGKWKGNYASRRYENDGVVRPYMEALVMGSFDASDIEHVIFPNTDSIPLAALMETPSPTSSRAGLDGSNGNFDRRMNIPTMGHMLEPQYWVDNENMSAENAAEAVKVIKDKGLLRVSAHPNQTKGLAAAKIKRQLDEAGIKMIVRNKQGLDYFDPQKWAAGIKADTVEQAIEAKIRQRIMEMLKESMTKAKK